MPVVRKAFTDHIVETRDLIKNGAGKDLDRDVVAAFESAFRSGQMELSELLV